MNSIKKHPNGGFYDRSLDRVRDGIMSDLAQPEDPMRAAHRKALTAKRDYPEFRPARVRWWRRRRVEGLLVIACAFAFLLALNLVIPATDDLIRVLEAAQ